MNSEPFSLGTDIWDDRRDIRDFLLCVWLCFSIPSLDDTPELVEEELEEELLSKSDRLESDELYLLSRFNREG